MASNPGTAIVTKIVFPVGDLGEALEFYRSLGFGVEAHGDDYAWVTHRGAELLHLARVDGLDPSANRAAGYLHVQDVDAWHRDWSAGGVEVGPVADQPWGMREFVAYDPARNLLRVGQNL